MAGAQTAQQVQAAPSPVNRAGCCRRTCGASKPYPAKAGPQPEAPAWLTATGSFIDPKYALTTVILRVLGEMDTETHGRFRNALAAAANRASQYGADAMLVLGKNTTGRERWLFQLVTLIMAAPIRADEAIPVRPGNEDVVQIG